MARGNVDEVDRTTDFYKYMFDMRKSLKFIDALVKQLESMPDNADLSQDFCISYVIELLRTYCENDDDYELALASYGFLEGFEYTRYKRIQRRTEEYWRYACKYDKHEFIEADWSTGSALTELRDAHIVIIGYLDGITSKIKSKNGGKLGLIEEVPKKLEFPKPREIEKVHDIKQEESKQDATDGSMDRQVKSLPSELNGGMPDCVDDSILETDQSSGANDDIKPTVIWKRIEKLIKYLRIRFRTKDVVTILILLFMAAGIWEIAQSLRSRNTEATNSTAMTENETLTITGITIHNADITLTPDKPWENLRVSIYPREANIDDVNYYSDNIRLVTVNKNKEVVKLASGWREETKKETKVHVQFEEIDKEVLVIVQEHTDDSTIAPGDSDPSNNELVNDERISGF